MRRRLYFLAPDPTIALAIVDELLLAKIEDRHMHVLAKEGIPLSDLNQATLFERTDLKESISQGLGVGGAVGAFAGLIAVSFPPEGLVLSGALIGAAVLAGAGFGAWVSGMIGISLPNRELKAFEAAIRDGKVLMLIDVPKERIEEIQGLIKTKHPEAQFGGVEPHIPVFP